MRVAAPCLIVRAPPLLQARRLQVVCMVRWYSAAAAAAVTGRHQWQQQQQCAPLQSRLLFPGYFRCASSGPTNHQQLYMQSACMPKAALFTHHHTRSWLHAHSQAHPRRVAKVASQIQREVSEMFIYDKVSLGQLAAGSCASTCAEGS